MAKPQDPIARAVVITGASTGIGAACALEMGRRGWRVFAGVRTDAAAQTLRQRATGRLTPLMLDLTDPAAIAEAARKVSDEVAEAGLSGLVNNAGIVVAGPLEMLPLEEFRKQLEINVLGQVAVTQAMLPLVRTARGRIVNVASLNGRLVVPFLGAYSASKFALEAISDALRLELRRWGIAVSVVEPGSVKTPIWEKTEAEADRLAQQAGPRLDELYGRDIAAFRAMSHRQADQGMPVQRVVRAVVHALTSRRPRTRYPVGSQTRWAIFAARFLPDRLRDWMVRMAVRMRDEG
jgi:NAD(P)-dependent dehydrogenase (short-subunit alcohol dehydrogenase family)